MIFDGSMLGERELQAVWYAGKRPSIVLRALAAVYAGVISCRRLLYRAGLLHAQRLPVPVVVVGNLTVGGTGKTPLVIALVDALRARGRRPGVVSRGYRGSVDAPRLLDRASTPFECGDEPVLIHRVTGAPVAVGRDRAAAARLLITEGQCDVVIADDGLQHYALTRDVEICVIDGARRFGNGRLLPAGPLREPLSRLESIPFHVCNGGVTLDGEVEMRLVATSAERIGTDTVTAKPLADFVGQRIHAVAAIGNPTRFFTMLRVAGLDVDEHPFADHHAFVEADLDFGDEAPVLMTQKDAVKCEAFARANHWQVPVRAQLPAAFFDAIVAKLGGG